MQYEDIEVGMRVKVVRRTEDHNAGWNNTWNPEMRKTVGSEKVFTVKRISQSGVRFAEDSAGWGWDWGSLELDSYKGQGEPVIIPEFFSKSGLDSCCAVGIIRDFTQPLNEYKQAPLDVLRNTIRSHQRNAKSLIIITTNNEQEDYNKFFESVGFHSTPWIKRDGRYSEYKTEVKLWWMSIQELTEKGLAD